MVKVRGHVRNTKKSAAWVNEHNRRQPTKKAPIHITPEHRFFQVVITETGKAVGEPDINEEGVSNFRIFNDEREEFKTFEEAKEFIKERYSNVKAKKKKMYRDTPEGIKQSGTIYRYKNKDWSHDTNPWIQEDWVEIRELTTRTVR